MRLTDADRRAVHAFWQSFTGAVVTEYAASGLDWHQITDVATGEKFAIGLGAALLAAVASAVKSTLVVSWQAKRDPVAPVVVKTEPAAGDPTVAAAFAAPAPSEAEPPPVPQPGV